MFTQISAQENFEKVAVSASQVEAHILCEAALHPPHKHAAIDIFARPFLTRVFAFIIGRS